MSFENKVREVHEWLRVLSLQRMKPPDTQAPCERTPVKNDLNKRASEELEYLKELEFGDTSEAIVRNLAVVGAGILIYLYTDWISALVWPVHYVTAWVMHAAFTYTRNATLSDWHLGLATLLFGNMQVAFGWLPVMLFVNESRELMLVGGALISAQLLFLVRRNDRLKIYQRTQIFVVIVGSVYIYVSFFPLLHTPLAIIGAALALIGLNYYFYQSLAVTRRMRDKYEAVATQAQQSKKMAAIGQLAGGVAHDFNNNLTAIMGGLELAKLEPSKQERDQVIDDAMVAAAQAARTVKQLLIFARKEQVTSTKIEVDQLFAEVGALTVRLIPASITLDVVGGHGELVITANKNRLLSGLVNIIANSIDAMPKGGTLRLSSAPIHLDQPMVIADGAHLDAGDYIQISVKDTGHGIPKEIITKVADPFFTTKPVGKGTGLGLSMALGMMTELNGGLSIMSSANGTEIKLLFPMKSNTQRKSKGLSASRDN
ncbi:sensor histidine kinase [Primorskyibacter sp. 2E233]|uniref:sensor histidine kinase n=1 Tax=Primorskyibacter sp. 2E233 TaxID=3413431 RepID=UPI003BEF9B06